MKQQPAEGRVAALQAACTSDATRKRVLQRLSEAWGGAAGRLCFHELEVHWAW